MVAPIIKLALDQTHQTLRKSPEQYGYLPNTNGKTVIMATEREIEINKANVCTVPYLSFRMEMIRAWQNKIKVKLIEMGKSNLNIKPRCATDRERMHWNGKGLE